MFIAPVLDIDNVFDAVFARPQRRPVAGPQQLHVEETDDSYVLKASLPGVSADDVELEVTADGVRLSATRSNEAPDGFHPVRRERTSFRIQRTWSTPTPVDADRAEAVFTHGVLTVTLPKAAKAAPRRLTVQAA